ncbi:hypothetical protein ACFWJT_15745 [Streptomyces sp. NPDC127069]|uniref:hypothetical protein n=1 Tax=Streptomyces sp. NPDC127069 TaxID=3347128 RepID=UPI003659D534
MPNHESVQRYIAARNAGNADAASRIVTEVVARYETRTTDGSELAELLNANLTTPLATKE